LPPPPNKKQSSLDPSSGCLPTLERRERCVARVRPVADDLPAEAGAHLPQSKWLDVAEYDDVLGIECDDEIFPVRSERYQAFRLFNAVHRITALAPCL
jgi:hypothetical protein